MDELKKASLGKMARQFVIDNYSIQKIGKKLEEIFDSMPNIDWDFNFEQEQRDENYIPPEINNDSEWLIDIYKNILKIDLDTSDPGHKHWSEALSNGAERSEILKYFRGVAVQENQKNKQEKKIEFGSLLDNTKNKRALFVLEGEEEDIFLASSLLQSFNESHPDYDIYFACKNEYHMILLANKYIHKILSYQKEFENELLMIGSGSNEGYFDYYCNLGILTQRHINYHGIDNKVFNLIHE